MSKSKKKRVNPNRQPMTKADVQKAKKEAQSFAIDTAWAILFTVLRDKEGYDNLEDLKRVWKECEELSDSIAKGYCSLSNLRQILKEEAGATMVD